MRKFENFNIITLKIYLYGAKILHVIHFILTLQKIIKNDMGDVDGQSRRQVTLFESVRRPRAIDPIL